MAGAAKSDCARVVEQSPAFAQTVARAVPATTIWLPWLDAGETKFPPSTLTRKPPTAPAVALAGKICVITGEVEIAMLADPLREASSRLVAVAVITFGDGASMGAVNCPSLFIAPHADGVPHGMPPMFQITPWSAVPRTEAENAVIEPAATVAEGGETETTMCGRSVIVEEADFDGSTWLVTANCTGFTAGTAAGAR